MAGNTGYQIASGSQTVTLPAYTTFGTEVSIETKWQNVWLREFPLLTMIKSGGANWNKGSTTNGTQMLIPIGLANATTPAAGVADADELTGITPYVTNGATNASYNIAHYRAAFYVRQSETELINNKRGNFMDFKTTQLTDGFKNLIANDIASANADSRTAVLGVQQPLATANTVGGIAQGTDTDWASNVTTGYGAFAVDLLDSGLQVTKNRGGKVQVALLAYSSSNDIWSKLHASLAPAERMVNTEFSAKYGYDNIKYRNCTCISDGRLTAGVVCGLDPTTWYYQGDENPRLHHVQPRDGTDAMEHLYFLFAGIGCGNPAYNFRTTGVS